MLRKSWNFCHLEWGLEGKFGETKLFPGPFCHIVKQRRSQMQSFETCKVLHILQKVTCAGIRNRTTLRGKISSPEFKDSCVVRLGVWFDLSLRKSQIRSHFTTI